tara:strand:+ start:406 stop:720 length:315 start_codon:yes stop_codon:yes gene_type:complete
MNKSLALRNKIYRFCFLLFSFFLFFYILYFLINAERGVPAYFKIIKKHSLMKEELFLLENTNKELEDKISRLSPNSLDLEYLDEQIRLNTGKVSKNELVIKLNN